MNMSLSFSIDLKAELEKLTKKQYLNDVHYLVQILRHALRFRPGSVVIESSKKGLLLTQDGESISDQEWNLLSVLLLEGAGGDPDRVQDALNRLEHHYGIAMLALFLNSSEVELKSGRRGLYVRDGSFGAFEPQMEVVGHELFIKRHESVSKSEELRELNFFCAGMTTPLIYNGKSLNREIELEDQMLLSDFRAPGGRGMVGVPANDDLCSFTFFKQGVRIGSRQFLPRDGYLFHGWFDSFDDSYEANFERSLELGEKLIREQAGVLFSGIAEHYNSFSEKQQKRLRKIIFAFNERWWDLWFKDLGVFQGGDGRPLRLDDLRVLAQQFGALPYGTARHPSLPAYVPVLGPEEINFLENRLEMQLRLCHSRGERVQTQSSSDDEPEEIEDLDPHQQRFLEGLNQLDPMTRFIFTASSNCIQKRSGGRRLICLTTHGPLVEETLSRFRKDPDTLAMSGYQLIAMARDARV